MVLKLIIY